MVQNRRFSSDIRPPKFGIRHLQCLLLFLGISLAYAMRVNLSLAIVAMTDKSANPDYPEYKWSEKIKSFLLSSFFCGYVTTQIPGGFLARKFGGKFSILIGMFIASALSMTLPFAASIGGWPMVLLSRILQGMSQGVIFPTTHTLLAKWAPAEERGSLGTYCYSGSQFGAVVMLAASGFLAASPLGWPSTFYISGGLGILWTVVWYFWGASSPNEYKTISLSEKQFIENSLQKETNQKSTDLQPQRTPWSHIFKSPPFWALVVAHASYSWGHWTILAQIPNYMKNIMGFNIKNNAMLTALPYLVNLILGFVFTGIAALCQQKKWLNLTQSRKTFNTISAWIPAIALVCLGYVDSSQSQLGVILLVIAVGIGAALHMGFQVNHIDLSPNFAGILLGVTNTFANVMSILAPITVGFVVTDVKSILQWRFIFFIAAGYWFFGNLLFIIFGTSKVQYWNNLDGSLGQEMEPMKNEEEKKKVQEVY